MAINVISTEVRKSIVHTVTRKSSKYTFEEQWDESMCLGRIVRNNFGMIIDPTSIAAKEVQEAVRLHELEILKQTKKLPLYHQ